MSVKRKFVDIDNTGHSENLILSLHNSSVGSYKYIQKTFAYITGKFTWYESENYFILKVDVVLRHTRCWTHYYCIYKSDPDLPVDLDEHDSREQDRSAKVAKC